MSQCGTACVQHDKAHAAHADAGLSATKVQRMSQHLLPETVPVYRFAMNRAAGFTRRAQSARPHLCNAAVGSLLAAASEAAARSASDSVVSAGPPLPVPAAHVVGESSQRVLLEARALIAWAVCSAGVTRLGSTSEQT